MSRLVPPIVSVHVKPLAEALRARGVIVLAFDEERSACASYGATKAECRQMAQLLDTIVDQIDSGELAVWEE